MATKQEEEFLDLCGIGDVESVKTLLAKDPSLINSKGRFGKFLNLVWFKDSN